MRGMLICIIITALTAGAQHSTYRISACSIQNHWPITLMYGSDNWQTLLRSNISRNLFPTISPLYSVEINLLSVSFCQMCEQNLWINPRILPPLLLEEKYRKSSSNPSYSRDKWESLNCKKDLQIVTCSFKMHNRKVEFWAKAVR